MAKRKNKKGIFSFLKSDSPKKKKKKTQKQIKGERETLAKRIRITLMVLTVLAVFAGIGIGFVFLERFVKETSPVPAAVGKLELMNQPDWINSELKSRIIKSAGGSEIVLNENTAKFLAENLSRLPWLYNVRVQTTDNMAQIYTRYRTPIAVVSDKKSKYYVAWQEPDNLSENRNIVVLDHFPIPSLLLVEIIGFETKVIPSVGQAWHADDVLAGIKLLELLQIMDEKSTPDKPLLGEIASVDISNFGGRKSSRNAELLLITKDGKEIRWGAPLGEAARHLEATEKEKLNKLYSFYNDYGTLKGPAKYIELRDPEKEIPRP